MCLDLANFLNSFVQDCSPMQVYLLQYVDGDRGVLGQNNDVKFIISLRCFDIVFQRPYRYFSIALKVISSLSDRYKILTTD